MIEDGGGIVRWQPPRTHGEFVARFCPAGFNPTAEQSRYIISICQNENHLTRQIGGRGGGKSSVRAALIRMLAEAERFDWPDFKTPKPISRKDRNDDRG